ncbi:MAG: acyloxyacyl hydrolase [Flavobacteriales bacterium]|nr:acyloxyacyl hydrolase [Flavobacteriales bacterium]
MKRLNKGSILLAGFALCSSFLFGQVESEDANLYIKPFVGLGQVLIHSEDLRPVEDSYPKVLGQGLTGLFFLEPVFGAKNKLSFSIRGAFGLSYQNKPFDEAQNPDNLSYSTRLAFPLQVGIAANYRISEDWIIDAGARYNHISNGGLKQPNKGINWPTLSVGVSKYFSTPEFYQRPKEDWRKVSDPKKRVETALFGTYQKTSSGKFLWSGGVSALYSTQVARISALVGEAEYNYDAFQAELGKLDGKDADGHTSGVAVGHEFILGNYRFGQRFGAYLLKPDTRKEDVYQRYSITYLYKDSWSFGVSLKAHGHVADFLDLRVGKVF